MEAEAPIEHDGKVALMEAKLLRDELRERMEQEEDEARARLQMEKELQVHRFPSYLLFWRLPAYFGPQQDTPLAPWCLENNRFTFLLRTQRQY